MAAEGGVTPINATGKSATTTCSDYTMNVACIGSDRPSIRDLYNHVVNQVAHRWRDLGMELLRSDLENELNIIAEDHPRDAATCCKRVFEKWLATTSDATWNELIRALRSPSVQLDSFANQLEQMLCTESKVYS